MWREKLSYWGGVPPASSREDNQVRSGLICFIWPFGGFGVNNEMWNIKNKDQGSFDNISGKRMRIWASWKVSTTHQLSSSFFLQMFCNFYASFKYTSLHFPVSRNISLWETSSLSIYIAHKALSVEKARNVQCQGWGRQVGRRVGRSRWMAASGSQPLWPPNHPYLPCVVFGICICKCICQWPGLQLLSNLPYLGSVVFHRQDQEVVELVHWKSTLLVQAVKVQNALSELKTPSGS